jgi:3-hydroxy-9,10-secoandrosta-1,3,5(10)-triene-9,17-dione monooxygenase reductase component
MFDAKELRRVMGCFATGVTVITTQDKAGKCYGLTANAVTSLSLVPPLILICIDRKAETFPAFLESRAFVVNVLAGDQEDVSTRFAKSGGDKFTGLACRTDREGPPVIAGALAHLECRIVETHEGGDHVIHVGEVLHAEAAGGDPLLFFQGKYRRLASIQG